MSALVVVLKQFSPFAAGDKEIDLASLPPPPAPEELDPMFMGEHSPVTLHHLHSCKQFVSRGAPEILLFIKPSLGSAVILQVGVFGGLGACSSWSAFLGGV